MASVPNFLRHSAFFAPEKATPVTIIGAGATGSNVALALAKLGFHRFSIWDADSVETHNLPNQAFSARHVGINKAEALASVLNDFNPEIRVNVFPRFFEEVDADHLNEGVVFIMVDSLSARRTIGKIIDSNYLLSLVVETRIGMTYGEINLIDPMNSKEVTNWIKSIPEEGEVEESPCNARIIPTLVGVISNVAAHYTCNVLRGESPPRKTMIELSRLFQVA